jgi:DNA polymerase-3 subunit epsilon
MILPNKYIVLDLETANRNRASICQIGITYIFNQTVKSVKTVNINPESGFEVMNTNLHGITERAVENSLTFKDVHPILSKILSIMPVFHHGEFDPQAIHNSCLRYNLSEVVAEWINSINYFEHYWPDSPSYKLEDLSKQNRLSVIHHDAGEDSFVTARLLNFATNGIDLNIPNKFRKLNVKGIFSGETIVFSGDMDKSALKRKAEAVGFEVLSSVTKKTDYLCLGKIDQRTIESGNLKSGKHKKAETLSQNGHHIQIISEYDFLNLISP